MTQELVSLSDYEAAAADVFDQASWAYLTGGAGDELTLAANARAFHCVSIVPRVLRKFEAGAGGTRTTLLGEKLCHPIMVAPVAYQRLAHPDGERATALAAAAQDALMVLSTQSSVPMEEIRAQGPACRWFQLYLQPAREATRALVKRAEAAGFRALVVTVDAPVSGLRNSEQRAGFQMPESVRADALAGLAGAEPRARHEDESLILDHVMPQAPTWEDVAWLRRETALPLVIKGILSADDAELAIEAGAAAIAVSNHGGRTLDTLPATLDVLPEIARRVAGRVPLILDGGIRRGTDVFKAIALGASAVMVGRPIVHGLAVAGAYGVSHVLRILRDELEIAMALAGCQDIGAIGPSMLRYSMHVAPGAPRVRSRDGVAFR